MSSLLSGYTLDDKDLKGGFRVVNTTSERDAIFPANRKAGMVVAVTTPSIVLYYLLSDLITWNVLQ